MAASGGIEEIFWQVPGVYTTAVGYAGGHTPNPTYEETCTARTGHTESALVVFDPAVIDLEGILKIFWESHDPTQEMRQGNDIGTQYRSAVYTFSDADHAAVVESAGKFQTALDAAGEGSISTEIKPPLEAAGDGRFYYAEGHHQQYLAKNPPTGIAATRRPASATPPLEVTRPITLRQWNRTLLARQHLLDRVDEDAIEVLDRCVGMQSQDPRAAFFGLWSRVEGFEPSELDGLLTEREVVRIALLRSTVFLVDAEDARWIRPLAEPILRRELTEAHAPRLVGANPSQVLADAAELLTGRELGGADLGRQLAVRHPGGRTRRRSPGSPGVDCLWCRCRHVDSGGGRGTPTYRLFDEWVGPGEPAVSGDDARAD